MGILVNFIKSYKEAVNKVTKSGGSLTQQIKRDKVKKKGFNKQISKDIHTKPYKDPVYNFNEVNRQDNFKKGFNKQISQDIHTKPYKDPVYKLN